MAFLDANPNIDNPKKFVIYVIILVVGLALIIAGFKWVSSLHLSLGGNSNTATTTSSTKNTEGSSSNTSTTKTGTHSGTASKGGVSVPVAYDVVINYTDQGFVPATLQIKAGTSVRFINKSGGTMRVASVKSSNTASDYTDLSQSQSLGKGGTYDFNFTRKGTWLYENLNNPTKTGVVVVN